MTNRDDTIVPPEGFKSDVVWLPKLFLKSPIIEGVRFEQCRLIGPGVMALLGELTVINCTFPGPAEAFLWEIPDNRPQVFGAMGFRDCEFIGCVFDSSLGVAGPRALLQTLMSATEPR